MCDDTVITWKAYAAMHVMQWRQTDKDSYRVSADRQTDLGTAVFAYMCEYSICSTVKVHENIYICFAFVKGV